MKLTTTIAVALSTFAATTSAASCKEKFIEADGEFATSSTIYTVKASGVGDIPGLCGGLWDNLHILIYPGGGQSCGGENGEITWVVPAFTVFSNRGDITSAWFRATNNDFGAIECSV